jgi:hypothetical protein
MVLTRIEGHGQVTGNTNVARKTSALTEFMAGAERRLGGAAVRAIEKRESREYADEREATLAKYAQPLLNGLNKRRAQTHTTPERINYKRDYITKGLDNEMPGWVANALEKISVKELHRKLYKDGKYRLVSKDGIIHSTLGVPTGEPPLKVSTHRLEDVVSGEAAMAAKAVRVAPAAAQAAEDSIVSSLPKDPEKRKVYARYASRLNRKVAEIGDYFQGLKGEELYANMADDADVGIFEKVSFGGVANRVSTAIDEYTEMMVRLADDKDSSATLGELGHYPRALRKAVLEMYNKNPGAQLALGPDFSENLNKLFKPIAERNKLIRDDNFMTGVKSLTARYVVATDLMQAMDKQKIEKIIAGFGSLENQVRAKASYWGALRLINPDLMASGDMDAIRVHMSLTIDPIMQINVEKSIENLITFGKAAPGTKISVRAKDEVIRQIDYLLGGVSFMASKGDIHGIETAIMGVMDNIEWASARERNDILKSIAMWKGQAEKAKVVGKPWFDGIVSAIDATYQRGKKFINKAFE